VTTTIPILMYHSVSDQASARFRPWTVSPQRFDEHMALVKELGYTPISVSTMVAAMDGYATSRGADPLPSMPIVLTFDDGFQDFLTAALPILQRYGFDATLYVVSGCVGGTSRWLAHEGEGDRPILTWPQLREIAAAGIECGAHSCSHPQLDVIPRARAREEIARSRQTLQDGLGQPVLSFAYPHGYHDVTVRRLAMEAGYSSACGVKHALSSLADDRYSLGRVIVTHDVDAARLGHLLLDSTLPIAPRGERLRTKGWRLARRASALLRGHRRAAPTRRLTEARLTVTGDRVG